ncbi:MAG: hypothetical protein LC733_05930, partial [Actinobacteria bacterium]|nr:hypothetical protein [Actinomycetota bacterium]
DPFDAKNWSATDGAGVVLGGGGSAALAMRGAALAGTLPRTLASGFAADFGTSVLVDLVGGNARPGQIVTNAVFSGTTGRAFDGGRLRGENTAFGVLSRTWPGWRQKIGRGNLFNVQGRRRYIHNEVPLETPPGRRGLPRVDSYVPNQEIVSRKSTQLAAIRGTTARRYLDELRDVYPPGARIADVPSAGSLRGQVLTGQSILEVPPQRTPVPQEILDYASDNGILIRDSTGRVLNLPED